MTDHRPSDESADPQADRPAEEREAPDRDRPGLLDDIPPTGDLTPGQAATRAAAPGIRQDPEGGPYVVDSEGGVVDTGSPQDYGEPNAATGDPDATEPG